MTPEDIAELMARDPDLAEKARLAGCPVHLGDAFGNNPYPDYAAFRTSEPIQPVVMRDGTEAFLLTRMEDVRAAFSDLRLSNNLTPAPKPKPAGGAAAAPPVGGLVLRRDEVSGHMMINQDPPNHTRLRKLITPSFAAKRVSAMAPRLRELSRQVISRFADLDQVDLVAAYAKPLPVVALSTLLGIPGEREAEFITGIDTLTGGKTVADAQEALNGLKQMIREEIDNKRLHPAEDLLTDLVEVAEEEGRMEPIELVAAALQVVTAGYFGPLAVIGNSMYWLLTMPEKRAELLADPSLIPAAVEELLRYDGPQVPGSVRYALEDVELSGGTIKKGTLALLSTSAANRDPSVFEEPDRLDFHRGPKHIGFGGGVHYCAGARLATVTLAIAIESLITAFPTMRLAVPAEELHWELRTPFRSLNELPVHLR
jgi:cytochrome P450